MNKPPTNGCLQLSVVAGICATIGSLFGKLAGSLYFTTLVSSLFKSFLLVVMVVSNTAGCTLFVKSLQGSGSSLPATVVSAATNYFCSALIGFLVFGESTSLMWWCGTSLVLLGLILICCTPSGKLSSPPSTKDKEL
ncbi:transmembrane protein 42 [Venturia canescens]|uniref:transmembrane protein 42 n=1 Tax=Venturia canescens TaxID=32260 RepID=UPI001C9D5CC2|nr:transmembrane protein 42-like [Venturia canescens]XP_043280943.1 transmembrane protein 42-like [Venturia canescens]